MPRNFPCTPASSPIGWSRSLQFTTILCPFEMFQTCLSFVFPCLVPSSVSSMQFYVAKKSTSETEK
jgi:hypothetical protein